MPIYKRKWNHKPTSIYCGGFKFDQSQMADAEFYDSLHTIDHRYTSAELRAEVTKELYRRAAQLRETRVGRTPEDQRQPVQPLEVSVGEIQWEDLA